MHPGGCDSEGRGARLTMHGNGGNGSGSSDGISNAARAGSYIEDQLVHCGINFVVKPTLAPGTA